MIKDRGNIKWTAMMLPEHVAMIKKIYADQDKVQKPQLDEQAWFEIELTIQEALIKNSSVQFTYWQNGYYETLVGRINSIDFLQKQIKLIMDDEEIKYLHYDKVVSVTLYDK